MFSHEFIWIFLFLYPKNHEAYSLVHCIPHHVFFLFNNFNYSDFPISSSCSCFHLFLSSFSLFSSNPPSALSIIPSCTLTCKLLKELS
ncbi:hypothetical protein E2C01_028642 [Portunus trituberculatus]|uniref:Uncharacterized protein n=1 Tax=Portunus trituberculatus TaxID=210409 RepID=A0A5B7EPA5_PORTR|nr:hypothetical protein [Portunus trituberculatus]